ncbi:MAG: hypothetical protein K8R34_03920 [Methanosarcinales archaeon]|nr:hypothetical protein [Methanosarcinales archaeon]
MNLQAIIPTTVLKEIIFDDALLAVTTGESGGDNWIKVMPVNNSAAYLKSLHFGEAGVIALAKQMNGIAALDDLDARKLRLHIPPPISASVSGCSILIY